jgi:hypothetical protein
VACLDKAGNHSEAMLIPHWKYQLQFIPLYWFPNSWMMKVLAADMKNRVRGNHTVDLVAVLTVRLSNLVKYAGERELREYGGFVNRRCSEKKCFLIAEHILSLPSSISVFDAARMSTCLSPPS